MRIENYQDKYFLDVVNLIQNFYDEAIKEYDPDFNVDNIIELIKTGDRSGAFLLILDDTCQGILYGTRLTSPTSGKAMFQESMWYVNKPYRKYGLRLLSEVEKVLKSQGVKIMIMAVLENSKTEKIKALYNRLGFKPMETQYVRTL